MNGISYLVDGDGNKKAVVIDLETHGDLLEDFFDIVVARSRMHEPRIAWGEIKAEMDAEHEEALSR